MRPAGYPLPWCEALDLPWWRINLCLCLRSRRYAAWQAGLPMSAVIPKLERGVALFVTIAPASAQLLKD